MKKGSFLFIVSLIVLSVFASFLSSCAYDAYYEEGEPLVLLSPAPEKSASPAERTKKSETIDENGIYTSKEDVSLYIHTYAHLPDNYITKKEAKSLGWDGGRLEDYAPGKCIGGDRFGNYEEKLPETKGRVYRECDIDTLKKKSRGQKRLVYSNDGLIYYTPDHYNSFTLLYGGDEE